jgi:hypothetical protein
MSASSPHCARSVRWPRSLPWRAACLRDEPSKFAEPRALLGLRREPAGRWPAIFRPGRPIRAASGSHRGPGSRSSPYRGEGGNNIHGARNVSSSRASRHCRQGHAPTTADTGLSGSASRASTGDRFGGRGQPIEDSRAAASVTGLGIGCGLQILLKSERAGPGAVFPQRPARIPVCRRARQTTASQDLVIGKREQTRPQGQQMPARFPLSTDEMYRGGSGFRDWVSYQL